ncbi:cell division protein FtsZ [Buchnera aphidicola str. APS (Acyrthosiphon pisum)]|uniref:Cell division protein FtsZ n=1 Tax=Buchnera aphidicola subsp. Acyrthosiphon pisum (strain APS) TaxID=107806 RepID=FTSZ_BUCAI|nr:cell division protein FtsZ [Buchnera aphidicola]P57308.1 RecName: Full=Cell division protein FtsZ [Buchnera aphidicola str. APS (Acyrthosiphon pisum)]pir/A84955/ cell division protein ftsZ [imported] - Buchnera sp. (strain APS) [Buchnera sp. (in: enterobacteria)]BAB12929.1 cell division protein ftsZ [Buchnera aphidicola str. APS (Acyrthosiphon pisum)]
MFEPSELSNNAIIKVIGVGGGGSNAVEHMVRERIEGVEFFAINTDAQALRKIEVGQTIQIGNNITKGLGAGANPEIGRTSAEEDKELLKSALDGSDMVFIAAGMGGGTGTGAAPVVAEIAKELGILTVAVVTKPFNFEGKKRMIVAEQGIIELSKYVDSLIIIPNDKLLKVLSRGISLLDAFSAANNVLKGAVQGIAELITRPGLMNVDFADVRTVMLEMGYAMMGTGISSGENRAEEASEIAISSPLLEDIDLSGARGVLVNITAGFDLKLDEFETVGNTIRSFSSDHATVVIGTSLDPDMNDTLRVTVVATGIGMEKNLDVNQIKNKSSREVLMDYRYQYLNISPKKTDKKIIKKEIKNTKEKINKEPEYLDIPSFLRKRAD